MDPALLVDQGAALARHLDATKVRPRAMMWVHQEDADRWRLWIVPGPEIKDKHEFYRIVAETITKHQQDLGGLDVGATEYVPADHPAMIGMGRFLHMPGLGSAHFSGNRFNGFYLPDGIVIRMDLGETGKAA